MIDIEQPRDRALDFRWGVPANLLYAAGVPDTADKLYDQARRSVLAAACIAAYENSDAPDSWWISYSRRKGFYEGQTRYQGLPYTYARVTAAVAEGTRLGLLEEERAAPGSHLAKDPRQSRFRATPDLRHAFHAARFDYVRRPCHLLVRGNDGRPVTLPETQALGRMRAQVDRINAYLGGSKLTLGTGDGWEHGTHTVRARSEKTGKGWASLTPEPVNDVVRIFSRGRADKGGRLYGWWQQLPKARRAECRINGEAIIEPDFMALHPTLLYAMRGERLRHDPYETGLYPRQHGKLALNVALNARTLHEAAASLVHSPSWGQSLDYTWGVLKAVQRRNRTIAKDIGSDRGIDCMRVDSDMAVAVLGACEKAGIACLPVHDSFMVGASQGGRVEAIMSEVLTRTVNKLSSS
ncbi:hypothetical protein [Methylobacterium ajmalii]|uniref:hypothetical protein n=1 Tax=Methylobacterium ajmalii TaxID=2738439 RepID=UPI00190DCB9A|nr:hypothetical protein [Methylobacterium ajmalii]MBK3398072.1 hypothetical protein [Methylobacterium ajmalii]MBK3406896.1 hypothetical protein [Methylobacterium ajmalii]MBK3424541.1 hypothetical protein [Methylobacterium ajmalii]MBZ6416496.1 hypothetical protein [Methylobacterium sp.]